MSNTPETQALLPVTQEARKAALDLMDEVGRVRADLYGPAILRGEWDECDELQAFARFERDIIASHRQSSSNAGGARVDVELIVGLRRQAHSESEASRMMAEAKSKRQANNPTGECVYMWAKPEETLSWKAAEALASLSTPTAEPISEPTRRMEQTLGAKFVPTPDRIGKDAVREALDDARNYVVGNHDEGCELDLEYGEQNFDDEDGERTWPDDRKCTCGTDEMLATIDRALSATPAPTVDETERLRSALREIAEDPYKHGQRVQKMKAIARAALQHKGEASRG